jgi:glucose/arabinose dehydrogenase
MKILMKPVTLIASTLILSLLPHASAAELEKNSIDLETTSWSIQNSVTQGGNSRGPAIAVLEDDTVILGGGRSGGEVFIWKPTSKNLIRTGSFIPSTRRMIDSRFAINDIAVLSESASSARLLISYPRLNASRSCVEIAVDELALDRNREKARFIAQWFVSKPCVPVSAVQHTAGRFEVIDKNTVYMTVGDLGYSQIGNRKKRGDLGSVFKLTARTTEKISQGHRNPQGIVLYNNDTLMVSEHGPRGGDELNIVKKGNDYGWPFVTYGQPYGAGDYVKPTKTGTHEGFVKPITYWVPSIAPTELVQLPNQGWGDWNSALVLGTLREEVLVFIRVNQQFEVTENVRVDVGHRVRDLEVFSDGSLVMSTDSGKLITATIANAS